MDGALSVGCQNSSSFRRVEVTEHPFLGCHASVRSSSSRLRRWLLTCGGLRRAALAALVTTCRSDGVTLLRFCSGSATRLALFGSRRLARKHSASVLQASRKLLASVLQPLASPVFAIVFAALVCGRSVQSGDIKTRQYRPWLPPSMLCRPRSCRSAWSSYVRYGHTSGYANEMEMYFGGAALWSAGWVDRTKAGAFMAEMGRIWNAHWSDPDE